MGEIVGGTQTIIDNQNNEEQGQGYEVVVILVGMSGVAWVSRVLRQAPCTDRTHAGCCSATLLMVLLVVLVKSEQLLQRTG